MLVNIKDEKTIPQIGEGPVGPIDISNELYRSLKLLGYHVELVQPVERNENKIVYTTTRDIRNVHVPLDIWEEDTTYAEEGYHFSAKIYLKGLVSCNTRAEVTFDVKEATCGNFSHNVITHDDYILIFAKELPNYSFYIVNVETND